MRLRTGLDVTGRLFRLLKRHVAVRPVAQLLTRLLKVTTGQDWSWARLTDRSNGAHTGRGSLAAAFDPISEPPVDLTHPARHQVSASSFRATPPLEHFLLTDCVVDGYGLVLQGRKVLVNPGTMAAVQDGAWVKSPNIRIQSDANVVVETSPPTRRLEHAVLLGGDGAGNYFHLMTEIAPRMLLAGRLPQELRAAPHLIPESLLSPKGKILTDALLPDSSLIPLARGEVASVARLVWIDAATRGASGFHNGFAAVPEHNCIDRQVFSEVRGRLLDALHGPSDQALPSRVFLKRGAALARHYNEAEVEELLGGYGFVAIDAGSLTLPRQVTLFADATHIVGPWGAAWTNVLFARPDARLLSWIPAALSRWPIFSNLARVAGAELHVISSPSAPGFKGANRDPFKVDLAALTVALDRIV